MIDPSAFTPPYDHHLCEGLSTVGCDVTLLTTDAEYIGWKRRTSYRQIDFFYRFTNRLDARKNTGRYRKPIKGGEHIIDSARLLRRLGRLNPDIIHFQWLALPVVDRVFIEGLRRIAPLVHTVHESTPYHGKAPSVIQRWGVRSIPNQFDQLIVHTTGAKRELIERSIPASKISVIPHGILQYPTTEANVSERSNQSSSDENVVLLFGGLKEYKGIDVLLRAFSRIAPEIREETKLKIAGSASISVEELRELAIDLGIEAHVEWDIRFIPDEEVAGLFRTADVVAFPYRTANQSGALMTALPYGKPIVASDVGGFSKVLVDGEHGRLVKPEDPDALSGALSEVLSDSSKRERMGEAVRTLSEETYSWEHIAERTMQVYETAVDR